MNFFGAYKARHGNVSQTQALEWCKHHKDYGGWVCESLSQASYPHTPYVYGEVHKLELKERKTWNLIHRLFVAPFVDMRLL